MNFIDAFPVRTKNEIVRSFPKVGSGFSRLLPAILAWLRNTLLAGAYLYSFNTFPEIFTLIEAFPQTHREQFWKIQGCILLFYALLAAITIACLSLLDHFTERCPGITLVRRAIFAYAVILASMVATLFFIVLPWFHHLFGIEWGDPWNMCFVSSISALVIYTSVLLHRAARERRKKELQAQLETDELNAALARAELSMLEAQIEPHFLFNTLAHIKRQYRLDADKANQMMTSLIMYLGRAMPALRHVDWTIGDELDLIRTYLDILTHRFGSRLRFSISVPESCMNVRLPALIVTTLVENAIRHGLSQKPEGGMVSITAEPRGEYLYVEVCDDGVGLKKISGSGLGLATAQARFRNAFGKQAELIVEPRDPEGVRSSIRIPLNPDL